MRMARGMCALLAAVLVSASRGMTPEEAFAAPPSEAHVGVWWHWMGGQVSREGLEKDLDWFVRMGITSATVFGMADCTMPWARRIGNVPTGIHPYDETWWGLLKFACAEGRRRGIDIGIHICPGYTSTGGPWIPSRLAMRELVFNVTNAAAQISATPTAYICPMYDEQRKCVRKLPCAARQTDVVPVGVGRGGVAVAHIPTGSYVQPADWASVGLECDKMNPEAVTLHMDRFLGELKRHLGDDLPAAGLRHVLLDSYEAGESNWTPGMREEFAARRGYDPLEFLPILGGYTNLYSAAEVEKFRADFDRTRKDLFRDVLFRLVSERLHAEGLAFANEPYYGPFEPEEVAPFVDRLMTEFWYDPKTPWGAGRHRVFNRFQGPGGRRHNVLEAEAFTGQPQNCMWDEMPATLKVTCDEPWLDGVNRFILHTCPTQPWGDDVKPGVTMGRWGTHFGRNQTWGEVGKSWFDYCARSQALLQWGEPAEEKLAVSEPLKAFGRTDGARTLWFVANRADVETPYPHAGRWFDPVSGRVGAAPSVLAPRQSGFFERVAGAAKVPRAARRIVLELTDFAPAIGDRSKSSDSEAKYFSGTMTYRTAFAKPGEAGALVLSLGDGANQVFVMRLNGREIGTVWCAPWEAAIPSVALCEGENRLEIDVVNGWRNRLIGDEQEPADCEWHPGDYGGGSYLVAYPEWFRTGIKTRPSKGRRCFSTWNYFTADSPLVPSGLIGPVRIETAGTMP